MKKYLGNIVGIQATNTSSIYTIANGDKAYIWNAKLYAEVDAETIKLSFNWNSEMYDVLLTRMKENYYVGDITYNRNEKGGKAYFYLFRYEDNFLLKGDWEELDSGNYECFLELKLKSE